MNTYSIKIMSFGKVILETEFQSDFTYEALMSLEEHINKSHIFRCYIFHTVLLPK